MFELLWEFFSKRRHTKNGWIKLSKSVCNLSNLLDHLYEVIKWKRNQDLTDENETMRVFVKYFFSWQSVLKLALKNDQF